MLTKTILNSLTYDVIGAAIEVHKYLGPGLLESVYEKCFFHELSLKGIPCESQLKVPIQYKNYSMEADLRVDVLIAETLVVELKATETILKVHEAQLLTYMKLLAKPKGIIINFNCANIFSGGQKTLVNELFAKLPE